MKRHELANATGLRWPDLRGRLDARSRLRPREACRGGTNAALRAESRITRVGWPSATAGRQMHSGAARSGSRRHRRVANLDLIPQSFRRSSYRVGRRSRRRRAVRSVCRIASSVRVMDSEAAPVEHVQPRPSGAHEEIGADVQRLVIGRDRRKGRVGPAEAIVEVSAPHVVGGRSDGPVPLRGETRRSET